MVSTTDSGPLTSVSPEIAPEIMTALSGASTSLSCAVIASSPVLTVEPAGMVNVVPLPSS